MTVAWPAFLSKPQRAPHSYSPTDVVARSAMNGGPPRTRQMFSAGTTQFSIQFSFARTQWALFEGFFAYELARGAGELLVPVDTGSGVLERRARFVGVPSFDASMGVGRVSVTATIELLDPYEMDEFAYVYTAYPDLMSDFDHLLNVVAPDIWN